MAVKKPVYNNDSISMLKGADRVRLRPAVIFGSDGIEGCEHSVFEILSKDVYKRQVSASATSAAWCCGIASISAKTA